MTNHATTSTYVEVNLHSRTSAPEDVVAVFDRVADALHAASGAADADLASDSHQGFLTFCVTFPGPTEPEAALRDALNIARDAIRAAGLDATAWDVVRVTVEPAGAHQPLVLTA